ncbi:MAG: hypothetical protein AAF282_08935 [Cyanobacteria bacterium P01_A01_bin.15]
MNIVEAVVSKIQILPPDKQQVVLDLVDLLLQTFQREQAPVPTVEAVSDQVVEKNYIPTSTLGKKLYEIRQRAIVENMAPMTVDAVNAEIAEHRRHRSFYVDS